jgi:hypothetical protein
MNLLLALVASLFMTQPAHAGKLEVVKDIVKSACRKDVDDNQALRLVKKVYLTCISGQDIEVEDGCKIKCLRENTGSIIGG